MAETRSKMKPGNPLRRRSGFSLIELMVAVTIIGVLAAMAVPSYNVTLRQSRADIAAANLRAIWAAQRIYWLEYHTYTDKLEHQASGNKGLVDLGLLDPMIFQSTFYTYTVPTTPDSNSFSVRATCLLDSQVLHTITIDQSGTLTTDGVSLTYQ